MPTAPFVRLATVLLAMGLAFGLVACGDSVTSKDRIASVTVSAVTSEGANIPLGNTQSFSVAVTSAAGTPITGHTVAWESSNPAVFTIDSSTGAGQSVAQGNAIVTATVTYRNAVQKGTYSITVGPPALKSLSISPVNPSLIQDGPTLTFTAAGTLTNSQPANGITITWRSSSPNTASIDAVTGVATGLAPGTTTITASSGKISKTTDLTVTAPVIQSIALTPANPSITVGHNVALAATATYNNGKTANVTGTATWASSNTNFATVAAGLVTGVAAGSSDITATQSGITGTTRVTVDAPSPAGIGYVYSAPNGFGDFVGYRINSDNSFTRIGTGWSTTLPNAQIIRPEPSPNGKKIYYSYHLNSSFPYGIGSVDVDPETGALSNAKSQLELPNTRNICAWALHPSGKFLYIAGQNENGASVLETYAIDPVTGDVTGSVDTIIHTMVGSASVYNFNIVFNPEGTLAYYSDSDFYLDHHTNLYAYSVNTDTGLLSEVQRINYDVNSFYSDAMAVGSSGQHLFRVAVYNADNAECYLEVFNIGAGGSVSRASQLNYRYQRPRWMREIGNSVFVSDFTEASFGLQMFGIDGAGTLTLKDTVVRHTQQFEQKRYDSSVLYGIMEYGYMVSYAIDHTSGKLTQINQIKMPELHGSNFVLYEFMAYIPKTQPPQ